MSANEAAAVFLGIGADISDLKSSLGEGSDVVNKFAGEAEQAGQKGGGLFSGLAGSVTSMLNPVGLATAGAGLLAGGLMAAGKAGFDMASETNTAVNDLQAKLGLTRDEAEKLGDVAVDVWKNNWGDSVTDVSDVITTVRQQIKGLSDDDLPGVTEAAIAIRDSFGIDVADSTNAANTLMREFGLSSKQAFDFIAAGEQKGLDTSGDFLDTITEYSTQFKAGGADAGDFFSIMESGLQGGVLGTDKAADAFKEFRVRIQDGSNTTLQGLQQLGINTDDLFAKMSSGKLTAADAFDLVMQKLNATSDKNVQMQAGVALLGTQFEDLGTQGALGLSMAGTSMDDLAGSTDSLNAKYQNLGSVFETIKRNVFAGLGDALRPFIDFINSPEVTGAIMNLAGLVGDGLGQAFGFLGTVLGNIGSLIGTIVSFFSPLIQDVQNFIGLFQEGGEGIAGIPEVLGHLWETLQNLGSQLVSWIGDMIPQIGAKLGEWGQAFLNWLPQAGELLGELGGFLAQAGAWIIDVGLPTIIQKLGEWGKAFIDWVGPQIGPMLGKLWELLGQLGAWLWNDALPAIIQKLGEWGKAFVDWLGPHLPILWNNFTDMLGKIGNWLINEALPTIVQKLGEWGGAFVNWVGKDALPFIAEKLGEFGQAVWTWIINDALPTIVQKLGEWGSAFLGWIGKDVLPFIGAKLGELWTAITNWIGETAHNILGAVADIGKNIVQGIWNGISGAWNNFISWLGNQISNTLPGFVKDWLGIHSPSQVFMDIGANIVAGLQGGIDENKDAPSRSMEGLFTSMIGNIQEFLDLHGDPDKSVSPMWRAAFNDIFQFMIAAWVPQMNERFKGAFIKWLDYESSFLSDFVQSWNAAMMTLQGPPIPGEGGTGTGSGGSDFLGGGGGGGAGGGHGAGMMGAVGADGGSPILVQVYLDGKLISQQLRARSDARGIVPSTIVGTVN